MGRKINKIFILLVILRYTVAKQWPILNNSKAFIIGFLSEEYEAYNISSNIPTAQSTTMFRAAMILANRYNYTLDGETIGYKTFRSDGDQMNALRQTCTAVSYSNVLGIVGPTLSREAHTVATFSARLGIPMVSHSATDPDLRDLSIYSTFYRTVPSDEAAAEAILAFFKQNNWTSCSIIHQNDAFGFGGLRLMSQVFTSSGVRVDKVIEFDLTMQIIRGALKQNLTESSSRIVIVWAGELFTKFILRRAIHDDVLRPHFTWILSAGISLDDFEPRNLDKLVGILTIEPVTANTVNAPINHTLLQAAYQIWQEYEPETLPKIDNIDPYALFAFDAAWSIILGLAHVCHRSFQSNGTCVQLTGPTFCFDRMLQNSTLLNEFIRSNTFLGVSGQVNFDRTTTNRLDENYYQMKNYRYSSDNLTAVNVLTYTSTNGWVKLNTSDRIIWSDGSNKPPSGVPRLAGVHLTIGTTGAPPFVFVNDYDGKSENSSKRLIGFIPDLLVALQCQLGFEVTMKLLPSNMTYNQMIQMLPDSEYDLLVGDFTITSGRKEIVDFSNAIFENSIRIMTRASVSTEIDFFSYLKPFSQSLWILILFISIVAGFLVCLVERNENHQMNTRPIVNALGMSLWYSFGVLLGYGVDFHAQTPAGRILTIGLYVMSLIFVATYTANLASDLTILNSKTIVSGIDDVIAGRVRSHRIGILLESAVEDYYLREISAGVHDFFPLRTLQEQYEKLLDGSVDIVITENALAAYMVNNVFCNLTLLLPDIEKSAFGMVHRKRWIYAQELDIGILKVYESGTMEKLRQKWFYKQICENHSVKSTSIVIESLSGLFLTFGIFCFIALVAFAIRNRTVVKETLCRLLSRN